MRSPQIIEPPRACPRRSRSSLRCPLIRLFAPARPLTVKLNGNRTIQGTLRGFDQFMNLVLDETMEIITWRQLDLHKKPVIIMNVRGYWDNLLALMQSVIAEGFMHDAHLDHFETVTSLDDMAGHLRRVLDS